MKFTQSKIFNGQVTVFYQSNSPSYFSCSKLNFSKSSQYSLLIPACHYYSFHSGKYSLFAVWIIRSFNGEKLIKIANLTYLTSWKFTRSKIFNRQVTILNQTKYPSYFFCSRLNSSKSSQYSLLIPAFHFSSFHFRKYSLFFVWIIRSFNGEKLIKIANLIFLTTWQFTRFKIFNSQVTILNQSNYASYFFCSRLDSSTSSQYSLLIPAFHYSSFHSRKHSLFAVWIIWSFNGEKLIKIANLTYLTSWKFTRSKIFNREVTILNQSNYPSYFFCSRLNSSKSSQNSLAIPVFRSSYHSCKYSFFAVWIIRSFNGEKLIKIANLTYLTSWKFTRSKIFNRQVTILNQTKYPSYFFCSRLHSSKSSQYSLLIPAFHFSSFHFRKYSLFFVWIIRSFNGEKLIKIANLIFLTTWQFTRFKIFNSQVTILNQSNYAS